MAGSKTAAKNSRTATKAGNEKQVGDVKLLIPLNGGKNAYVRNPKTSKNPNLATSSDQFVAAIADIVEAGQGDKVRRELLELNESYPADGWDKTLARVQSVLAT